MVGRELKVTNHNGMTHLGKFRVSIMFGTCDKFEQSDVWIDKFCTITNSLTDPNWYRHSLIYAVNVRTQKTPQKMKTA